MGQSVSQIHSCARHFSGVCQCLQNGKGVLRMRCKSVEKNKCLPSEQASEEKENRAVVRVEILTGL